MGLTLQIHWSTSEGFEGHAIGSDISMTSFQMSEGLRWVRFALTL